MKPLPPPANAPDADPTAPPPAEHDATPLPPPSEASAAAKRGYRPGKKRSGVALCLSGGGYRAALFHLGAVRALNELGALGAIDTVTSVSGGSILAAHLAHRVGGNWPSARGQRIADFDGTVADSFHELCTKDIRTMPLLVGLLTRPLPSNWDGHVAVRVLEANYRRRIGGLRLVDLPKRPNLVFCATDMAYGVNWTFSRALVGSYMAGYAPTPSTWTVARAVAASSCFPPFFNPQPVGLPLAAYTEPGLDDSEHRAERLAGLRLSDGGLYDNMGLEPVWKSHEVLLVSEGGSTFDATGDRGLFWRLNRYVEIMGRQGGAQRKRWLISNYLEEVFSGAYWGIGTEIDDYESGVAGYPAGLTKKVIAEVRTDLDEFNIAERSVLENHGYLLTQAALRRYAPSLMADDAPSPKPPHDAYMDPELVAVELANSHKRTIP